ncbi:hypothetical protein NC653_025287 [Populus alba x Populus x berolinensis]|uniref:Wall-associated receptor kinase galacturonan-binding domain-containing protein n=1 Tax=Populus alba x Populus x berolinensis TaxID=444605 RepID=A0AAD6MAW5_9ROSI|nr:hypothetical protein NC653_025287 [Populus alba x Populus x berolinensis]
MNLNFFLTPFSSVINLFIVTFFLLAKKASCTDPQFLACNPESCGDGQNISFPFHIQGVQPDYCGYPGFTIYCNDKGKPVFNLSTSEYIIHEIHYQNQSLRVSNAAVSGKSPSCTPQIQNISLDDGRFHRSSNSKGLFLLYNCNSTLLSNKSALSNYKVDCPGENETVWTLAMLEDDPLLGSTLDKCGTRVLAPVDVYRGENVGTERMLLLEEGFVLNWTATLVMTVVASVDLTPPRTISNVSAPTDLILSGVIPYSLFFFTSNFLSPLEKKLDTIQIASPFIAGNSVKSTSHSPTPHVRTVSSGSSNFPMIAKPSAI